MLLGRYYTRISVKGRVALPSRFRKIIGQRLVVARWYENCLVVVSIKDWEGFTKRITLTDELLTQSLRGIDRFVLGSSFEIETDSQGRFVVPRFLRDFAKLEDEIVFLGLSDRVEIWDKKIWEEYEKGIEAKAYKNLENLGK